MNDRKNIRMMLNMPKGFGKARRRVQMRSALLLTLGVCFFIGMHRLFASLNSMVILWNGNLFGMVWEILFTALIFGGALYLGLCVLDGDQRKMLPRGALSGAQVLWLALAGATLTAPTTLGENILHYFSFGGVPAPAFFVAAPGIFVLRLAKSALLVPVLEELFFRGYLLGALERYGRGRAVLVSALCFAAVHMGGKGTTPHIWLMYAGLGLLYAAVFYRTGSLLAPMLMHGSYNAAVLFLSYAGPNDLFVRLSPLSAALRLGLCAAFVYCLRRAWMARGTRVQLQRMERLTKKEAAFVIAAFAAACLAVLIEAALGVQG